MRWAVLAGETAVRLGQDGFHGVLCAGAFLQSVSNGIDHSRQPVRAHPRSGQTLRQEDSKVGARCTIVRSDSDEPRRGCTEPPTQVIQSNICTLRHSGEHELDHGPGGLRLSECNEDGG